MSSWISSTAEWVGSRALEFSFLYQDRFDDLGAGPRPFKIVADLSDDGWELNFRDGSDLSLWNNSNQLYTHVPWYRCGEPSCLAGCAHSAAGRSSDNQPALACCRLGS